VSIEIVIPAHNEQHRIARTLQAYRDEVVAPDVTITVALDDCTDDTGAIVAEHAAVDSRVRATAYPRLGKGGVLAEAMRASHADQVAFVDADCATPPAEVKLLAETLDVTGADLAIASRWHPASVLPRHRTMTRRLASKGFSTAVRRAFGLPFHDTQCGAKVMTRAAAQRVMPLISSRDFLFDVDLLVTARALGLSVAEMPTVWIDQDGSRVAVVKDTARMAASLGLLWLHHRVVPVKMPSRPVVTVPVPDELDPAAGVREVAHA
jgi:glycosyltransferase involved in cell wall biosynthesis